MALFVTAAQDVLHQELGSFPSASAPTMADGPYRAHAITALVGVVGDLRGALVLGLAESTATALAAQLLGTPPEEAAALAPSGIAELANVIAGHACTALAHAGLTVDISPPTLILGAGSQVTTVHTARQRVELTTPWGPIELQLALSALPSSSPRIERSVP